MTKENGDSVLEEVQQPNRLAVDFYANIKHATELLSAEELELTIEALKGAREMIKEQERKKIIDKIKAEMAQSSNGHNVLFVSKTTPHIPPEAYRGNHRITKVIIENGVIEIGEHAFADCPNLQEVVFPQTRINLRRGCFSNCVSLRSVSLPSVSNIGPMAFRNCRLLETLHIPNDISNIYSRAFQNCSSLKTVTFQPLRSASVYSYYHLSVCSGAFENCTSLTSIEIPGGVYCAGSTFRHCHRLKEICFVRSRYWQEQDRFKDCDAKVVFKSPL